MGMPHDVITSSAFAAARGSTIKLLVALAKGYYGHNNGLLTFTFAQAVEHGFTSNETVGAALREAVELGLLVPQLGADPLRTWLASDQ